MKKSIDVVDKQGMYLYSMLYEAYGKELNVYYEDRGSLAGIPTDVTIHIENPNVLATNPDRVPLDPNAVYQVIIIQKNIERK